ncbi:uncharacterized protein LOC111734159 [Pteropus vampyrus]|uniref:Uncharacterized protein LOC111734159 n=1 Tax=Pteropus vampyrus TaxID=132908 RepID=A0A6P6C4M7_PTEVA|nr:uncharacterized protein LOC111734159 [Pteropus vampyrus]
MAVPTEPATRPKRAWSSPPAARPWGIPAGGAGGFVSRCSAGWTCSSAALGDGRLHGGHFVPRGTKPAAPEVSHEWSHVRSLPNVVVCSAGHPRRPRPRADGTILTSTKPQPRHVHWSTESPDGRAPAGKCPLPLSSSQSSCPALSSVRGCRGSPATLTSSTPERPSSLAPGGGRGPQAGETGCEPTVTGRWAPAAVPCGQTALVPLAPCGSDSCVPRSEHGHPRLLAGRFRERGDTFRHLQEPRGSWGPTFTAGRPRGGRGSPCVLPHGRDARWTGPPRAPHASADHKTWPRRCFSWTLSRVTEAGGTAGWLPRDTRPRRPASAFHSWIPFVETKTHGCVLETERGKLWNTSSQDT